MVPISGYRHIDCACDYGNEREVYHYHYLFFDLKKNNKMLPCAATLRDRVTDVSFRAIISFQIFAGGGGHPTSHRRGYRHPRRPVSPEAP